MNQHKPNCSINIRCAVYHADGICNHPIYGKCDCGADSPSQPNSEDGKMMYGHSSGNEVQFSHSPKPEEKCPLGKGHKYSEICRVCTPLPDTTEEKCKYGHQYLESSLNCLACGESRITTTYNDTSNECPNCGGDINVRNPTGVCDHLYYPDNVVKNEISTWETEFDDKFIVQWKDVIPGGDYQRWNVDELKKDADGFVIKSFIKSLLSQSEQRVRKEMVEAIKEMVKQKGLHLGYKNNILELLDELMK